MSVSNIVVGKRLSIEAGEQIEQQLDRPSHAPMFARPGEPEPNCVVGERLQPPQARLRRRPSRKLVEAREHGLSMPEALDLTPDEVASWLGAPPESAPDQR
ncbi:hypothetical protein [Mycobacterium asiaticum]|uniref:Uncharacterized protein n=1 Tax=Mycobacterium asiaticum TaxID=1790 RepID=A0A1A3KPZ7_MYCAS|nr:hypothetical protein [Mycobacterium asiaticum]OBJ86509.1 hypothetical protein A5640_11125 [Mycobacterium asiaticum]